jgi:mono/diheme cytochrome c family protein
MRVASWLRFRVLAALALVCPLLPLSAQEGPAERAPGAPLSWNFKNLSPEQQQRMIRFSTFVNRLVPEDYLKAENDVGYTVKAIAAGGPLYARHCSRCHGTTGQGDGTLATALSPSPALLAYMVHQPIAVDQYLLWSISEGGKAFGTAMPSFKDELAREQIWQIIAYLRAGFPDFDEEPKPGGQAPAAKTDEPPR